MKMEYLERSDELTSKDSSLCKMCLKEPSRYTCPRCNVQYCCVDCYKCTAHAGCSEGFYKDCFMEGLQDMKSPGQRQEVMEMLKRVSEQEDPLDSDDEEGPDLVERLDGLNLDTDTEKIWSRLSDKEKAEFQQMMRDGRLGELVDVWAPWWTNRGEKSLVEDITNGSSRGPSRDEAPSEGATAAQIPITIETIPDINVILKNKDPSDMVQYNLINIIYGYAYISRLYNGEFQDVAVQSSQELLRLSTALGVQSYESTTAAVQGCVQRLANQARGVFVSREFSVGVLMDVQQIISGPGDSHPLGYHGYVIAALSDLHRLFSNTNRALKKAKRKSQSGDKQPSGDKEVSRDAETGVDAARDAETGVDTAAAVKDLRQTAHAVCKKCEFLLAWVHRYGARLHSVLPEVQIEFCEMSSRLTEHRGTKQKLEKLKHHIPHGGLHKLIEEVVPSDECR